MRVDAFLSRLAGTKLHHHDGCFDIGLDIVNRDDMFVDDGRRGPCFPGEPLACHAVVRKVRSEQFDRHGTIKFRIVPLEYDPHPTGTDHAFDSVTAQPPEHVRILRRRESGKLCRYRAVGIIRVTE